MDTPRAVLRRWSLARRLVYWYRLKTGQPDWRRLTRRDHARWTRAVAAAQQGPQVLIATSIGAMLAATNLESALGVALTLRGARVHFLLCDAALPACQNCLSTWYPRLGRFVRHGPAKDLCGGCFTTAEAAYRPLRLPVHRYGAYLSAEDRAHADALAGSLPVTEIPAFTRDGVAVGEHAVAGALRFFARGALPAGPEGEAVLRRYFTAALLTVAATQRLLRAVPFDSAVFNHGIYVPQGLIGEVARRDGVRVVNWNPAYRKRCFIFSHGDTYHHTLVQEPVDRWIDLPWTEAMERTLSAYLRSRARGTDDWIWFHDAPQEAAPAIERAVGVDFSKVCIGMLTNVAWDAQLHYPANAFPDQREWVVETIRYFATRRPDLQLVIRVHPAELRGTIPSRQPVAAEIRRAFPVLPPNVFVIPPESPVSTYAVMARCDAVLIYGTKMGVELTSIGIPVIVAGEAWIRNKGLTLDASSAADYFHLLDRLPLGRRLDGDDLVRARKYAYHFFFRRMIPVECMEPWRWSAGLPPFRLAASRLDDLGPGRSVGLDVICDGILRGQDFIYPAESLGAASVVAASGLRHE